MDVWDCCSGFIHAAQEVLGRRMNCALSHRRVPLPPLPPSFTDKVGVEGGESNEKKEMEKRKSLSILS
jgi:hypothetical protein